VALTFSENVRAPAFVILTGPGDVRFDQGPPQILNATVTERLSSTAPDGKYTLAYRVVSADGHPVGDELTFTLAGTQKQAAGGTSSPPTTASQGQDSNPAQRQDGIHWSHGLVGILVVAAGAAALLHEFVRSRHQARR
jgi:hypothetical protein